MSASVDVLALVKWQERGKLTPFVGSSHGWTHRAVITLSACLMASGCVGDTAQPRRPSTDAGSARLSGTWAITLRLERPASLATDAKRLPRNVEGTVMLLEDHDAARSFAEMKDPTYIGVYDIDLDSLELPPWDAYVLPGIAERSRCAAENRCHNINMNLYNVPRIRLKALRSCRAQYTNRNSYSS